MIHPAILQKLEELPDALQTQVLHYIDCLLEQHKMDDALAGDSRRQTGALKGTFVLPLSEDFDAPLEEFQDYME